MATVDSPTVCVQCGFEEAFRSENTSSGEVHILCPQCGRLMWTTAVRDRVREMVEGGAFYKLTKDGRRIYRRYERPGHGVLFLSAQSGFGQFSPLSQSPSDEMIAQVQAMVADTENGPHACYLTRWTGDLVEFVIGSDEELVWRQDTVTGSESVQEVEIGQLLEN